MATKKITSPPKEPSVGYGYVGQWIDGRIGWFLPRHHLGRGKRCVQPPNSEAHVYINGNSKERFFLCKITVKPVFDKKGRPITKIVKPKS